MKLIVILTPLLALGLAAQELDLKFLDKLGEKASESSTVTIGPEQMKLMGAKGEALGKLRSIVVRSYEFDKPGMYDLAELRRFADKTRSSGQWEPLVESKERNGEFSYILVNKGEERGFLIISGEEKELAVVYIRGPLDLSDLSQLGNLGGMVPDIEVKEKSKVKSTAPAKATTKQEEE